MKKFALLFMLFVVVILVFAVGCSNDAPKKKLTSRPIAAKPVNQASTQSTQAAVPASTPTTPTQAASSTPTAPARVETRSVVPAGTADCEQLASDDLVTLLGGTWSKTTDCPQRPMMPKGVSVCRCDYDGPKQLYVNVETQLYGDVNEANRVFDMYCKGATASTVATKACSQLRSSETRPNFVYFLDGNYFVKVSCLGGSCPISAVEEVAKQVESKI